MPHPAEFSSTKSEFAYTQLREKILSGALEPGQVLHQAMLARSIGISTTPLREALRRLKSEGLVELDAHRDARITELTPEEARDLLEVRRSLDPLAVSLAAERRTKSDIAEIRDAAKYLEPLARGFGVDDLIAHRRFHAALYRASHNDLLIATLDGLWAKADRYRRVGMSTAGSQAERDEKAAEHAQLVEYVAAGAAEEAAAIMHQHIATSLGAKAVRRMGAPALSRQQNDVEV
jgi:DNA-binding GntR family transcriptional regulator